MLETDSEKKFKDLVNGYGCLAVKLNILAFVGMPDRLILGPARFILFFEMKTKNNSKPSPIQDEIHMKLREFGFSVFCPTSYEEAEKIFTQETEKHKNAILKSGKGGG